jgi:glycosyltransferase involved in cell wall biosynthesis
VAQPARLTLAAAVVFLNERELLPRMLVSIGRQLRTPELLLLVDDGSSDGSYEIAMRFAAAHPYARVMRGLERERTSDRLARAHELIAFQAALEQLDREHACFDVYAKLDADLELPPDYLARIMAALQSEPKVGIAGSQLSIPGQVGEQLKEEHSQRWHVRGATKFYRRECLAQILPLPPFLGWDTIDEMRARRLGYQVCNVDFPEQPPLHLRPTGSYDGVLRGYRRRGAAAWGYGAHPLNVAASVAMRMRDRPRVLAGLAYLGGYLDAGVRRAPRVEPETRRYLQCEQLARLRAALPLQAVRERREANRMQLGNDSVFALDLPARDGRAVRAGDRGQIVFLVENETYPHDRRVRQEALALTEAGYRVTVVCPNSDSIPALEEEIGGVRVLRFRRPPQGRGALGYAREYMYAFVRTRRLVRKLCCEQVTAVIACNPPDFLPLLALPLRRRGAGLIFDLHDPAPELFEAIFHRRGLIHHALTALERHAARSADVTITVNEPCAALLRGRDGVAHERVYVLVTCPDPRSFVPVEPRPELRRGHKQLVLWLGRMSRKENLPLLVDAADEIVNTLGRDDVCFALVGDGDVRSELEADVERRGLSKAFVFPGMVGDDRLCEWMTTADVCVSLDQRNPMNDRSLMIKVMEYMAMGRPIVQFPLAEMRRVCADASVYADENDPRDLARKIIELLDDPGRRSRLGEAARARLTEVGLVWPQQVPILLRAVEHAVAVRAGREYVPDDVVATAPTEGMLRVHQKVAAG